MNLVFIKSDKEALSAKILDYLLVTTGIAKFVIVAVVRNKVMRKLEGYT